MSRFADDDLVLDFGRKPRPLGERLPKIMKLSKEIKKECPEVDIADNGWEDDDLPLSSLEDLKTKMYAYMEREVKLAILERTGEITQTTSETAIEYIMGAFDYSIKQLLDEQEKKIMSKVRQQLKGSIETYVSKYEDEVVQLDWAQIASAYAHAVRDFRSKLSNLTAGKETK